MKIQPKLPESPNSCCVSTLKIGDCFICSGRLQVLTKLEDDDPEAVDLATGIIWEHDEDTFVVPVDCTISWAKKPQKKKKK